MFSHILNTQINHKHYLNIDYKSCKECLSAKKSNKYLITLCDTCFDNYKTNLNLNYRLYYFLRLSKKNIDSSLNILCYDVKNIILSNIFTSLLHLKNTCYDYCLNNITNKIEMYDFINNYTRPYHLTLGDIKQLKVGDELDVVIWDRNFEEYWIWKDAESEKLYNPEYFFKSNRHKLKLTENMTWNIKFPFGETYNHSIHLDVSELSDYWIWMPLSSNGNIVLDNITKNWTEFHNNTRIGWRGAIMLWDKLKEMSSVYHVPQFIQF